MTSMLRTVKSSPTLNRNQQSQHEAMLTWINKVQATTMPRDLHTLVFSPAPGVFNCLERKNTRPPILNDILLCTLAIKVWELHGQFLEGLVSCINLMRQANGDAIAEGVRVHAVLAEWLGGGLVTGPCLGHLAQVGYILLDYRKSAGPWKWENTSVLDLVAHAELYTNKMKICYDVPNDIKPNLQLSKVNVYMKPIIEAQATSSHVLEHYNAVYVRLLASGKDLPDVVWLQKSLHAQQTKGPHLSNAIRAPDGSFRRLSTS